MYCAMKKTALNRPANSSTLAVLPAENERELNSRIGSIGSRARSSQSTNMTASRAPVTRAPMTSELPHPAVLPRTRPQTTPNAAPVTSANPGRSSAAFGPRLSLIRDSTSGIAASPIGTLSQKIHCHARPCVTAPPTTGPATTASPVIPPNRPSAWPRRSGGNAAVSNASATGATIAAPAPWTARAAIRKPTSVDSAHAAEAETNKPSPIANSLRRPNRSPSDEPVISSTAKLSAYALTVHSSWLIDACRCRRIVLSAVDTTVTSSATISDEIEVSARTHFCLEVIAPPGVRFISGPGGSDRVGWNN